MPQLTEYRVKDFFITGISKKGCVICTYAEPWGKPIFITNKIYNRMLRSNSVLGALVPNEGQYQDTFTLKVLSAF